MTDRELLELAAKAAGYQLDGMFTAKHPDDMLVLNERGGHSVWNPLRYDGDAARLEYAMCFDVAWYDRGVLVGPRECSPQTGSAHFRHYSDHAGDKQAAVAQACALPPKSERRV